MSADLKPIQSVTLRREFPAASDLPVSCGPVVIRDYVGLSTCAANLGAGEAVVFGAGDYGDRIGAEQQVRGFAVASADGER